MTVKEIIEALEKCNPDANVYVRHYGGHDYDRDEHYNSWSEITSFIDVTANGTEVNFMTDSAWLSLEP
ncbi:MAG: hypothetical protein IJ387_04935 [Thermoguttaceae bacterium]|nr:hypothetical protein [Thermoguttaceae bacterium]